MGSWSKTLGMLSLAAALLAAQGCKATCEDACTRARECADQTGLSAQFQFPADCESRCEAEEGCGDRKQEAIDCLDELQCESSEGAIGELVTCSLKCPALSARQ